MYDLAKEVQFDVRGQGNKSTRDRTQLKLLKSPAIMTAGISYIIFLSSVTNELCKILKLLLQEKHAGNKSDLINEEIVAIVDKLVEYKCLSMKQHKQVLIRCNLLHTNKK